jgi:hypothetical protein
MSTRFNEKSRSIYSFGTDFLVRCPQCDRCAQVVRKPGAAPGIFVAARLVCAHCGLNKESTQTGVRVGAPVDWYFHQPLWLQAPCCGQVLWAYNLDHLSYLERYVRAELRYSRPQRALPNALPAWIKAAKNRADVLRCIARLRATLE